MKRLLLATFLFAASSALFAAQLYRWVDEKGNVEWRDTPPPPNAKKIESRRVGGGTAPDAPLPYNLQVAMKNFPVTLWTTDCGDTCTKARAHLDRRGVPYAEKDPRSDFESFKKLTGGAEVPVVFIGATRLKGYLESDWDAALDTAGYPKTAPPGYKPKPKPAAAPAKEEAAPKEAEPASTGVRLYTSSDCGPNCTEARQFLSNRGIPFQEISVAEPPQIEELKKVSGDTIVPVLLAGRFMVQGFDVPSFTRALDQAGIKPPAPQ